MKFALPLILVASPAIAHHEALVLTALPGLMIWLAAIPAAGLAAWLKKRRRKMSG